MTLKGRVRFWIVFVALCGILSLPACVGAEVPGRLSAIVTFEHDRPSVKEWLREPGLAFIEAHAYFEEDLGENVIFGIDQELFEGVSNPIRFPGADWMALAGVTRNGILWLAAGTPEMLAGTPSEDRNWVTIPLGVTLQPNTWYRLHMIADFADRRFVNFTIEGPGVKRTVDLSMYRLDYPNELRFTERAKTYYVWTIHAKHLGGSADKNASVYFDDVRYGFVERVPGGGFAEREVRRHDFEGMPATLTQQPYNVLGFLFTKEHEIDRWESGKWYLEREVALVRSRRVPFARSGQTVVESDASLEDVDYDEWAERP